MFTSIETPLRRSWHYPAQRRLSGRRAGGEDEYQETRTGTAGVSGKPALQNHASRAGRTDLNRLTIPRQRDPSTAFCAIDVTGHHRFLFSYRITGNLACPYFSVLHSTHSVIKPNPECLEHQRSRWERIARDAAQQSEWWTFRPSQTRQTSQEFSGNMPQHR